MSFWDQATRVHIRQWSSGDCQNGDDKNVQFASSTQWQSVELMALLKLVNPQISHNDNNGMLANPIVLLDSFWQMPSGLT